MMDPDNPFTRMQREFYAREAARWSPEDKNPVVGAWDRHENYEGYDLLFDGIDTARMIALDFGCGPGRMIRRYANRFLRIDGADINRLNLTNAMLFCAFRTYPLLYLVDGVSLKGIDECGRGPYYDLVFSTLCLQHIPVHAIRMNLFREFYRVLKPGGWLTAQMGFGDDGDPRGVGYYEDKWDAQATNGGCDTRVEDREQLRSDLEICGFAPDSWRSVVVPAGPNDWHPEWIFFRAQKPE